MAFPVTNAGPNSAPPNLVARGGRNGNKRVINVTFKIRPRTKAWARFPAHVSLGSRANLKGDQHEVQNSFRHQPCCRRYSACDERRIGHPRLRQKSGARRVSWDQCLQRYKRLRDRKQRVQGPEFLQGPWLAAGQVGSGMRGERRHGRLIASRAGGRLYRTDAVSIGRLLGFAAREIPRGQRARVASDASAVRYSFFEDNRMDRPSSLGFGLGLRPQYYRKILERKPRGRTAAPRSGADTQ
jgi:hypothetical protein